MISDSYLTRISRAAVVAVAAFFLLAPLQSSAQQAAADVIKGRIVDDSSRAIAGATIMVTRGPDRLTQQTTSDVSGNYSTKFDQGTGDYLVYVTATGYKSARRRVQRQQSETELVANFSLGKDVATLDAVKVTAQRPVRATNEIRPTNLDP